MAGPQRAAAAVRHALPAGRRRPPVMRSRLTVPAPEFRKAVALASKAAGGPADPPAFQALLCRCSGDRLAITGRGPETEVTVTIPCTASNADAEAFAIPAGVLAHAAGYLDGTAADIEVTESSVRIAGRSVAFDLILYPSEPPHGHGQPAQDPPAATVTEAALHRAISSTVHAAERDAAARPSMAGVHLAFRPGTVTAVATDGARLAVASAPASTAADISVTIPLRAAQSIVSALDPESTAAALVSATHDQISVECGNTRISCRAVRLAFPSWEGVAARARACPHAFQAHAQDILRAVSAALGTAPARHRTVTLEALPDTVRVTSSSPDLGSTSAEITGAEIGEIPGPLRCALNAAYLADALRAAPAPRVTVRLCGPTSPCAVEVPDSPHPYLAVIAPVRT